MQVRNIPCNCHPDRPEMEPSDMEGSVVSFTFVSDKKKQTQILRLLPPRSTPKSKNHSMGTPAEDWGPVRSEGQSWSFR